MVVSEFLIPISWIEEVAAVIRSIFVFVFVSISRAPDGNGIVEVLTDLVEVISG